MILKVLIILFTSYGVLKMKNFIKSLKNLFKNIPNLYIADGHHRMGAMEHI